MISKAFFNSLRFVRSFIQCLLIIANYNLVGGWIKDTAPEYKVLRDEWETAPTWNPLLGKLGDSCPHSGIGQRCLMIL